jgi:hypothetical protein
MKDFTAKYGIKINDANPDGSSQDELNAVNQLKGQDRAPDVLDVGTAFAVKGAQSGVLAPYKVASWDNIPADAKDANGHGSPTTAATWPSATDSAKVKTPPTSFADLLKPAVQEPGRHQRQPDPGQRRVLGRLRLGPGQRRLAGQHRARRLLLQEAALRRQLRPGHGQRGDHAERPDADHRLVGLPAGVRDRAERQGLKIVIPSRRLLRGLLRPGHQQVRPAPGRGPAVGGVPVLHHRPEPVAPGRGPADRAVHAGEGRHRRPGRPTRRCRPPRPVTSPSRPRRSSPRRRTSSRSSGPA